MRIDIPCMKYNEFLNCLTEQAASADARELFSVLVRAPVLNAENLGEFWKSIVFTDLTNSFPKAFLVQVTTGQWWLIDGADAMVVDFPASCQKETGTGLLD